MLGDVIFRPRPPVFFGNTCVYRGFSTGSLVLRPPVDLTYTSLHPSLHTPKMWEDRREVYVRSMGGVTGGIEYAKRL